MQINRQILIEALAMVKPGLANKDIIEQSTSFAFMEGRVVTYNDEISFSYPIDLSITGAIPAEELYTLLGKIKKDEIEVTQEENEIIFQTGKMKAGISLASKITLPLEMIGKIGRWYPLPEQFLNSLRFAVGACSRDMSRPALTAVHVNHDVVEATDNYRIMHGMLHTENPVPVGEFLLPANSATQVLNLSPMYIAEGKGWIHFKDKDNVILSCRVYEESYPNVTPFLTVEGVEVTFPEVMMEIIDRACIFTEGNNQLDKSIQIILTGNNKIRVESRSEVGWFEEEANIRYKDKEPITFSIIPHLLRDILSETSTCVISEDRLKFEGDGWIYITVLSIKVE